MSRRGNCYDNAVAESFFSNLKNERVKRKIYATREEAKSEIFEYIEVFYNRKRRHSHLNQLSPMVYEQLQNVDYPHFDRHRYSLIKLNGDSYGKGTIC
jgi:putative transposase